MSLTSCLPHQHGTPTNVPSGGADPPLLTWRSVALSIFTTHSRLAIRRSTNYISHSSRPVKVAKEPETIVNRKRSPPVETITLRLWKGLAGPSVTRPTEHRPLRALSDIASLGQLQREEKAALGGNLTWCAEVYTNNSRLAWSSGIASVLW